MLNHLFMEEGLVSFKSANIQHWPCILLSVDFTLHKINLFICERMIIILAGYNEGFVPNAEVVFRALSSSCDYHGEMNHKMIVCWLEDKLVPNLPPKCVLVMGNAACHYVQVDRRPLMATKKHPIQEWLARHSIKWSAGMLKDELLELCKTHNQETPDTRVVGQAQYQMVGWHVKR